MSVLHLLRRLVAVERQPAAGALHDDAWAEAAQDARLVVFCRVQLGDDGIVRICQVRLARRTDTRATRIGKTESL